MLAVPTVRPWLAQRRRAWQAVLALLMAVGAGHGAAAQSMYRCQAPGGTGSTVISDKPCVGVPSKLGALGNTSGSAVTMPPSSHYTPPMGRAPDYLPYLSPACAQLNDAVRTGPARGLKPPTQRELQAEYHRQCAEDEQEARQQLYELRGQARQQRREQRAAAEASQAHASHVAAQCAEMLRILHGKRSRMDTLTPGQKDDLKLFEKNYRERCPNPNS